MYWTRDASAVAPGAPVVDGRTREAQAVLAGAEIFHGVEAGSSRSPTICDLSNSPADKTIYAKKKESRSFHVIISGTVKIGRCSPDRREKLLAIMGPSNMFGELSIIDPLPRASTATAITDVYTMSADPHTLRAWIREDPEFVGGLDGAMKLIDRHAERGVLDRLLEAVRAGESRALVVSGEAGVGKTALLDYLARQASGCGVVRTAGCQSEMELAFAALHQLCSPLLGIFERYGSQRDALRIAFGMGSGPTPDRFLVGLAVLNLLSDAAEPQPVICVVDDEQWLDRASAQVLGFVARRLVAESVGMVVAARVPSSDIAGLSDLTVEGLPEADARALLDSALNGPLDSRVRDQILAETHGNPLALLELPRGLTPQELAGGYGLPNLM